MPDGEVHVRIEAEDEPPAGEDDVALIEDMEEDSGDVSDLKLLMRRPNRKKSHGEAAVAS